MFRELINLFKEKKLTISTMESCTGGGLSNSITNIEGSNEVFNFGAVTYSNFYKIKMGVSKEIIDKYSVYSMEVAKEMSRAIVSFTGSTYGIGITGKLNRRDKDNLFGKDNVVFISIYDSLNNCYDTSQIEVYEKTREENKEIVLKKVYDMLMEKVR